MKEKNYSNPLSMALERLQTTGKLAVFASLLPAPMMALAFFTFWYFRPDWYHEFFLVIIMAIFCFGQFVAFFQFRTIRRGTGRAEKSVATVAEAGFEPDLKELQKKLRQEAPDSHIRDIFLRWFGMGLLGDQNGHDQMKDTTQERRARREDRTVSFHVALNRVTLKLGFLGTLIGLMMTFTPMKDAILALQGSEGEMKFIKDIAEAIEGDRFAIYTTLIATGLSIFIEMVTIFVFERILSGFEQVNSHLDEWNISVLQSWVKKHYMPKEHQREMLQLQEALEKRIVEIQEVTDRNLQRVMESVTSTERQMDSIVKLQAGIGQRVFELADYEKQYRNFLQSKKKVTGDPENLV